MEFLQANWLWLLLGFVALWLLLRRGGMGCGMGGHGSHGSRYTRASKDVQESEHAHGSPNGHGSGGPEKRETETNTPRRHRGC